MSSLKKNVLKNGVASFLRKVVKASEQLLLVPFFISVWGSGYYGEWLTLTIIPSVIAFSDLGFGSAVANSFVLNYASGDYQKSSNINKIGLNIITIVIIGLMFLGILSIFILNEFNVFDNLLINKNEAIISVLVLTFARMLSFYSQVFQAYFTAARRASLGLNLFALKTAINLIVGLLVLLFGYGVVEFSISQLIVEIIYLIFFNYTGKRLLGLFEMFKGEYDKKEFKIILKKGLGYLLNPLWRIIYFQGTTFVVRIVLGPQAVAIFNTVRTFSRSINQLFSVVNASVLPELQYEIGVGNLDRSRKLFRVSLLFVFFIAFVSFIFLAFFGLNLYEIWTKNELHVSKTMWFIFLTGILFNALWITSSIIYRATNKPYSFAFYGILAASVSVTSSYFLSIYFGLTGAAAGNLLLDLILAGLILPDACNLLGLKLRDIFRDGTDDIKEIVLKFKHSCLNG